RSFVRSRTATPSCAPIPRTSHGGRLPGPDACRCRLLRYRPTAVIAYVPTPGTRTVYATIGDVFDWFCTAILGAAAVLVVRRSLGAGTRSQPSTGTCQPVASCAVYPADQLQRQSVSRGAAGQARRSAPAPVCPSLPGTRS